MVLQNEKEFEDLIESALIEHHYIQGDPKAIDREFMIDVDQFLKFVAATQNQNLKQFQRSQGIDWQDELLRHINWTINKNGMSHVLKHGIEHFSLGEPLRIAYFKPNTSQGKNTLKKYRSNIFSVVRQFHCDHTGNKTVDMVLMLNGFPLVAIELKNPFSGQTVTDAMKQFKARNSGDLLFQFNRRVLVNFAVDTDRVFMTTHLKGEDTFFLPFNKGDHHGAGNPIVDQKYKTHYLWEHILKPDTLLDIFGRFYYIQKEDKKEIAIFPRFHQFDVIKTVEQDLLKKGVGERYLIQHSAGSGKTNSISWLAHRLASIHNDQNNPLFDSIIVITDRRVLDKQLQDAIFQLEHQPGLVAKLDEGKRSRHLAELLKKGFTKIIITTIQKFPYALEQIKTLDRRNYAVIIDEAHSSTTGENMEALKETLAGRTLNEAVKMEQAKESSDDRINRIMEKITQTDNISFFAFTATPKHKTIEIFGRIGKSGKKEPFHIYSMRQAIEEGFILDVLHNYTIYETYYKIGKTVEDDPELDKKGAKKAIARLMSIHEHNIRQKTEVIVDDFFYNRKNWLNKKAKGMVVTASRLHAVKYKLMIDAYIKEKGYDMAALVAFSGTVKDKDQEYTESSMNQTPGGRSIKEGELPKKFDQNDRYKLLIVAEKYQTGFDQPKLVAMYVDKELHGVKAVQTLSRLNRTVPHKETFILDFHNRSEDIINSFKPFYQEAKIKEMINPNELFQIYNTLQGLNLIYPQEVEQFATLYFKKRTAKNSVQLDQLINYCVERFVDSPVETQVDLKKGSKKFMKLYHFVVQIYPLRDIRLYKLLIYLAALLKKLPKNDVTEAVHPEKMINLEYYRLEQILGAEAKGEDIGTTLGEGVDVTVQGLSTDGKGGGIREIEVDRLTAIIDLINEQFGLGLSEVDRIFFEQLTLQFKNLPNIREKVKNNSFEEFMAYFCKNIFLQGVAKRRAINNNLIKRVLGDISLKDTLARELGNLLYTEFSKDDVEYTKVDQLIEKKLKSFLDQIKWSSEEASQRVAKLLLDIPGVIRADQLFIDRIDNEDERSARSVLKEKVTETISALDTSGENINQKLEEHPEVDEAYHEMMFTRLWQQAKEKPKHPENVDTSEIDHFKQFLVEQNQQIKLNQQEILQKKSDKLLSKIKNKLHPKWQEKPSYLIDLISNEIGHYVRSKDQLDLFQGEMITYLETYYPTGTFTEI